jgi:very-short-patch-repair endonuclease
MKYDPNTIARAKLLRKNMPEAEVILWSRIRNNKLGVKFRRQQPIGIYYVDFICHERKIAIELDGDQHGTEQAINYDNKRTDFIKSQGYDLIRIPNGYIKHDLGAVVSSLVLVLNKEAKAKDFFCERYD